jgi:hypothetical protein
MTRDKQIDLILKNVSNEGQHFSVLYQRWIDPSINPRSNNNKVDLLMNEMLGLRLIKYEELSLHEMGVVVIDYEGARINETGGWLKHKLDALTDEEKIHRLLEFMLKSSPDKYSWSSEELQNAFENALDQYEVEYLAQRLIDDGIAHNRITLSGFGIGVSEKTKQAFAGKKYLKNKGAQSVAANQYDPNDKFTRTEVENLRAELDDLRKRMEGLLVGQQITYDDLHNGIEEMKALTTVLGKKNWFQTVKGMFVDWGLGQLTDVGMRMLMKGTTITNLLN